MLDGHIAQASDARHWTRSCVHRLSAGSPTLRRIAQEVCGERGWSVAELRADYRRRPQVHWRQEFMARAFETGLFSLPTIGRFLGKDHTTVLHGVKAHKARQLSPTLQTGQVRAGDDC